MPMLQVSFKSTFAVVVLHYSEGSHHRELQDHDERRSSGEPRRSKRVREGGKCPVTCRALLHRVRPGQPPVGQSAPGMVNN